MTNILDYDEGLIFKKGYALCPVCKNKTILVTQSTVWEVDAEPYKSGESTDVKDGKEVLECIETDIEITGHWCVHCNNMVSVCINKG